MALETTSPFTSLIKRGLQYNQGVNPMIPSLKSQKRQKYERFQKSNKEFDKLISQMNNIGIHLLLGVMILICLGYLLPLV